MERPRQSQDHVAVALAGAAHGGETINEAGFEPNKALARRAWLGFIPDGSKLPIVFSLKFASVSFILIFNSEYLRPAGLSFKSMSAVAIILSVAFGDCMLTI
jgi:hypothetical protein